MANRLPIVLDPVTKRLVELPAGDSTARGLWTRLSTATPASDAVVDFTLPSGYIAYLLVFSHLAPETDNIALWVRTSTDGGSTFDAGVSDYRYSYNVIPESGTNTGAGSAGAAQVELVATLGNAAGEYSSGDILFYDPAAALFGHFTWKMVGTNTVGANRPTYGGGRRVAAADVNAVRLMFSSGDIASGQVDLFGLAAG